MDGTQSGDKEGARLCFKSLALPAKKRLRCCIEYAQMLLGNVKLAKVLSRLLFQLNGF